MEFFITDNILGEIVNQNFSYKNLTWDLKNNQIWYGDISNGYDIENKINYDWGSFPFLYGENETLLFDKNSKIIDVVQVSGLEKFRLFKEVKINLNKLNIKGTVLLLNQENFSFEGFFNPFYILNNDLLLFLYEENLLQNYDCVLIDNDFGFVLNNKKVIGFFIENASNKTNISKEKIFNILEFYTQEKIELMEDESSSIKIDLLQLLKNEPQIEVQKIYSNLLNVYYNIDLLKNNDTNINDVFPIYKSYQGKDYTEEEWKKFEEEEYKKYVEKRSGKKSSFLADEETEKENFIAESSVLKDIKYFVMNPKQDIVPVYQYPSTMGAIITTLQNGTAIDVLNYKPNDWSEILSKDGKKGYIQSNYVKKND